MNKTAGIFLIIAACLILTGAIVFVTVMCYLKWDFKKLFPEKYETNTHTFDERFGNIIVRSVDADVVFALSENESIEIVCYDHVDRLHSVSFSGDSLFITHPSGINSIGRSLFSFDSPKITIFIPAGKYGSLSADLTSGDVEIPQGLSFDMIDISLVTGDVKSRADVSGDLNIKTTTGDIDVEGVDAQNIEISVTTGDVKLSDSKCRNFVSTATTGDLFCSGLVADESFFAKRISGDIILDRCDGGEITVRLTSGDLSGTLLSEKVFVVDSVTGSVDVPESASGGKCEINITTGDIKIAIADK